MVETLEKLNHVYGCDGKLLATGLHVWHRELGRYSLFNSPVHYFLNTQWEKVLEKKQTSSKNLLECIAQTQTNVETNAQIQAGYNLG